VPESPVTLTDDGPLVKATLRLPGCPPERVLNAFTDPAVLAQWWGGELATDLTPGTPYIVRFTRLGVAMTGEVISYQPASHLEFSWQWDYEQDPVKRAVLVAVTADDGGDGTDLTVTHGPHGAGEAESTARAEHHEGWQHFLTRLAALLAPHP
jgi:uncharacterized protein YndB with AHSA1/START domain